MRDDVAREVRERASLRAERAFLAWAARSETPVSVRTSRGEVILTDVQIRVDSSGLAYLDVWIGGQGRGGEPGYRIVNPPNLVPDPSGGVVVHGERWREDPLAALAEVIGSNGGAIKPRRRLR